MRKLQETALDDFYLFGLETKITSVFRTLKNMYLNRELSEIDIFFVLVKSQKKKWERLGFPDPAKLRWHMNKERFTKMSNEILGFSETGSIKELVVRDYNGDSRIKSLVLDSVKLGFPLSKKLLDYAKDILKTAKITTPKANILFGAIGEDIRKTGHINKRQKKVISYLLKTKDGRERLATFLQSYAHGKGVLEDLLESGLLEIDEEARLKILLEKEEPQLIGEEEEGIEQEEGYPADATLPSPQILPTESNVSIGTTSPQIDLDHPFYVV